MQLFKDKRTKVLIVGGDNLGYHLAKTLIESGNKVCVIEKDKKRCEFIKNDIDADVICGDGTRLDVLTQAKTGFYDVLVAVTGRDEDNLVSCEIAKKQFEIKKTVSRSNNPKNIPLMQAVGVDIAVNTTRIIADMIDHELDSAPVHMMAGISNSDAVISEYKIPLEWKSSGKKVMELEIPEDCVLVYLIRSGSLIIPRGNTVIMGGDAVLALTLGSASKKLKKLFEIR